jgi:hypothetical protein
MIIVLLRPTPAIVTEPQLFDENVISTADGESHPAFMPDGKTLYFFEKRSVVQSLDDCCFPRTSKAAFGVESAGKIDKGTIRRRERVQHVGETDKIFEVRIGGKQNAVEQPELFASLYLALRRSSCVAFSWRRIFFP